MRVNITVAFEVVEEIASSPNSVDLADFAAAGMDPAQAVAAVIATIEADARKARGVRKEWPGSASAGGDYPLDPDAD